jgi:hypothetical protein
MNKVVVQATVRSQLHDLDSELELCDESGRTLGYFVPASEVEARHYEWARAQFTDEELERARGEPGGRTTAEILARLGRS